MFTNGITLNFEVQFHQALFKQSARDPLVQTVLMVDTCNLLTYILKFRQ